MLMPISDDDRTLHKTAWITVGLIITNILVFFLETESWIYAFGLIPYEFITGIDLTQAVDVQIGNEFYTFEHVPGPTPIYLTMLTSMFLHGDLMHLGGNMLYLWIFGDNVENRWGSMMFLFFYLISGLGAGLAQVYIEPSSFVPMVGASGAISGVLGAYLVLFPKNKVRALLFYFPISIPAIVAIGAWIVFQLLSGFGNVEDGVAYAAHIGGFFVGVLFALIFRKIDKSALIKPITK